MDTRSSTAAGYRVCAVIVTYHPEPPVLAAAVEAIAPQVGHVLLIDNATPDATFARALPAPSPANATILRNRANLGLGAAYNQAARHARASGCTHLLLLDQDSIAAPDMVEVLAEAHERLGRAVRLAAVGPCFVDTRTGRAAPFVRIGFPFNQRIAPEPGTETECDFLISSGTLVALDVLDAVGGMDETLFIDNIDIEWSFRARRNGYRLYGVGRASMKHTIGDDVRCLPFGLGEVVVHSPTRLYYMTRNRVVLYRRPGTPRVWIAQDVPRLLLKFIRLVVFVAPRGRNAWAMAAGVLHGWRGRSGVLPNPL